MTFTYKYAPGERVVTRRAPRGDILRAAPPFIVDKTQLYRLWLAELDGDEFLVLPFRESVPEVSSALRRAELLGHAPQSTFACYVRDTPWVNNFFVRIEGEPLWALLF